MLFRSENIVNELHNEKMDIIEWDPDIAVYIAKALGPAKVLMVYINEAEKAAKVIVPDNQLSLAIGKEDPKDEVIAKAKEVIADKLTGNVIKEIYVPGRIVNIVMK